MRPPSAHGPTRSSNKLPNSLCCPGGNRLNKRHVRTTDGGGVTRPQQMCPPRPEVPTEASVPTESRRTDWPGVPAEAVMPMRPGWGEQPPLRRSEGRASHGCPVTAQLIGLWKNRAHTARPWVGALALAAEGDGHLFPRDLKDPERLFLRKLSAVAEGVPGRLGWAGGSSGFADVHGGTHASRGRVPSHLINSAERGGRAGRGAVSVEGSIAVKTPESRQLLQRRRLVGLPHRAEVQSLIASSWREAQRAGRRGAGEAAGSPSGPPGSRRL